MAEMKKAEMQENIRSLYRDMNRISFDALVSARRRIEKVRLKASEYNDQDGVSILWLSVMNGSFIKEQTIARITDELIVKMQNLFGRDFLES